VTLVHRILYPEPIETLAAYRKARGGNGLTRARELEPEAIVAELEASGLRGRGGAGFPTGRKWRTMLANESPVLATTVVVNAAEGEPGTFKDRTILRNDPYQVLEGALIAALVVGARTIIFATKRGFDREIARVRGAIAELTDDGWVGDIDIQLFEGPHEYLYGEETALLETIDGRYPFPRVAPPYRRGVVEVVEHDDDATSGSGLPAHVEMASATDETLAPPALVDNVETFANVAHILARGADWFRTEGTDQSPGTIVCTITGATRHHGVGEVLMGTPLRDAIEEIGGGARAGRTIIGVLPGVSNAMIPAAALDTPLSYESMAAIGSGLGSAGFIVLDDADDPVSVAAGASRFLAVESCGQCVPCKLDGLRISQLLAECCALPRDAEFALAELHKRIDSVADRARCSLATQQQVLAQSVLDHYRDAIDEHLQGRAAATEPYLIAELVDIVDGAALLDARHRDKQPDWTYDAVDSGQLPAERFGEHRRPEALE
jgi:NADH:ubiquinone oxidoreductase subunit F (NADH-binding)